MRRSATASLAGLLLLAAAMSGCGGTHKSPDGAVAESAAAAKSQPPVLIFAAASTSTAIDEIRYQFKQESGVDVRTSYAASSTLAQQIAHGGDADIFLSADSQWADYVAKQVRGGRRRDLLGNRLVIIVPADSKLAIQAPADLTADSITHVAVGDPASVPIGKYAKRALEKLGIWEKLESKIAAGADVRQALAFVETGAAEAGIVYATDAAISRRVRVVAEISEDLTGAVRYPLLLLQHSEDREAAEAFYRYLQSPSAARVFEKFGFHVLHDEPNGTPRAGT